MNKTLEQLREEARKLEDAIWLKENESLITKLETFIEKNKNNILCREYINESNSIDYDFIILKERRWLKCNTKRIYFRSGSDLSLEVVYREYRLNELEFLKKEKQMKIINKKQFIDILKSLKIDTLEFFI